MRKCASEKYIKLPGPETLSQSPLREGGGGSVISTYFRSGVRGILNSYSGQSGGIICQSRFERTYLDTAGLSMEIEKFAECFKEKNNEGVYGA